MRRLLPAVMLICVFLLQLSSAWAQGPVLVKPRVYDPGDSGIITSSWAPHTGMPNQPGDTADHGLVLEKSGPTSTWAAAVVEVSGVAGFSTDIFGSAGPGIGFDFLKGKHCGAGAPRFNVYTDDDAYYFFGCVYGTHTPADDPDWEHVKFSAGDAYASTGARGIPLGKTITKIWIIFDEGTDTPAGGLVVTPGSAILDNIFVGGATVGGKPGAGPK